MRKEFSKVVEIRDCELYPTFIVQGGRGSWSYLPLSPQADLLSLSLGKNASNSVISLNYSQPGDGGGKGGACKRSKGGRGSWRYRPLGPEGRVGDRRK